MAQRSSETGRIRQRLRLITIAITALAVALAATCALLASANKELKRAIQRERMDYVNEISNQLIAGHHFMTNEYSRASERFAGIIDRSGAESFDDIAACFTPGDYQRIMLISSAGKMNDLNGKMYFASERDLISELCVSDGGVKQMFASLNNEHDYWLFASPIEPANIGGSIYTTSVLAVPAEEFAQTLAVSLFDNSGASFIIREGGSIEIKPDNINIAFGGYNLFASLGQYGASDAQVNSLSQAVAAKRTGSLLMEIGDQQWLFGFSGLDDKNAIVVAIPLTLTAARTYAGLSNTLWLMAAAIVIAGLIAFLFILGYFYRDRERRRQTLAAEAKSSFFSKMSHDIRTPLNAIMGLQTLISESADLKTAKEYNAQSANASSYLLSILNDVLDMSRIESGKLVITSQPFDMNALLNEAGAITAGMADEKQIAFASEIEGAFDNYYIGDAVRVKQVLINLLNNAVKFTLPQGKVALNVTRRALDDKRDEVTMCVKDTGIGISPEYLSKVFIPFEQEHSSYTQQFSGSGLGLAIVESLVTLMGGVISVNSVPGKGTEFTIVMPFARGEAISRAPQASAAEEQARISYAGKHVLLAEDNKINQMIAAKLLSSKFDITAELAQDGRQALNMFDESGIGHYDLILMDIKMPNMDGLEAARAIRALKRPDAQSVPIVALSANAYVEDVALSLAAGMNAHLSKPIDVQALSKALQEYIKREGETV